ncbi:hypothetical protein SAMN05216302_10921 [Nitrosomonas aestuarii]|uniref:Uncharacterized protein n=1 Tax=Nitrosomonas aestuarii TaxID=52441 RepID=A0A1I4HMA9_9PROT|nr:hypothetical protein [Nitrosomonas aestuarii]SFL43379.1 hypothetical protein SAMN05216302_10921 [Nitrosomonas aestuarii]
MFIKLIDLMNFIFGIPGAIARNAYLLLVMLYILFFKGRIAFNMYYHDFMSTPPLTINEKLKWDFIGATILFSLVAYSGST